MKIVVFDNLPDGGAKRVVYEQVKRLEKDHEVMYITNQNESMFDFEALNISMERYDLQIGDHSGIFRFMSEVELFTRLFPSYLQIEDVLRKFTPDVVVVHPDMYTQAPMLLLMTSFPTVYYAQEWLRLVYEPDLHDLNTIHLSKRWYEWLRRQLLRWLDNRAVKIATVVVVNSEYTRERFVQGYGVDATVIYPGVDIDFYTPTELTKKRDYFLFVGAKDEMNGYDLLQGVMEKYQDPFRVKQVSYDKTGFVYDDEKMVRLYQKAAAVLSLGRNEPFGLTPVETMACGTPVIALNQGGYAETVVDGVTGFLVEPTASAVYKAMKDVARNTETIQKMGHLGRQRVEEMFSWKEHMQLLMQVIKDVTK